jgi:hypothetical protein
MGPARRAHHPNVRNGCFELQAPNMRSELREPRPPMVLSSVTQSVLAVFHVL